MEFLGHFSNQVKDNRNKNNNSIDFVYETVEQFCEATSKMLKGFKGECKFIAANKDGDRHFLAALDYRFISTENTIRVYTANLKKYQKK